MGREDEDVARYGQGFKDRAVARLLPPESADVKVVAAAVGVSAGTLERWRPEALASGKKSGGWTAVARFEAVLLSASMSEAQKAAWCREKGLFPSELENWRGAATQALRSRQSARSPKPRGTGSASWRKSCGVKTGPWRKPQRCSYCQKKSRRSTAGTRTNDPRGRAS